MFFPHKISYLELPIGKPSPSTFERILTVLDGQMQEPTPYGWFHLICLAVIAFACIFTALKCKNRTDKQVSATLCAISCAMLFFEVYKQLNVSYDVETGKWAYAWSAFPFQFCSTPMYVLLLAGLLKPCRLRDMLYAFSATYGIFAGLLVLLYPTSVFTETIGVNIQTMFHHGAMVFAGVFLYATGRVKIQRKTVIHGAPVFAVLLFIALVMNAVYATFGDPDQNFNMFYLSPNGSTPLDFLDELFAVIPYPIILIGYAGGFTGAGYAISACALLLQKLSIKIASNRKQTTETNETEIPSSVSEEKIENIEIKEIL